MNTSNLRPTPRSIVAACRLPLLASLLACSSAITANAITMGFDASYVKRCENKGAVYKTSGGTTSDIFTILKSYSVDCIRLRVWVNPSEGYCNKADVLALAKRAKNAGISQFYLSFHFSDTWADPGRQTIPSGWGSTLSSLNTAVYNHTKDVVAAMIAQGTPPTYVSLGNEINCGVLWSVGEVCYNARWSNLAQLLTSARNGVTAAGSTAKFVLHINQGGSGDATGRWFFDNIKAQGVQYDVIATSYYPYWHGSLSQLYNNLVDLRTRYGKQVMVAECSYPWTLSWKDNTSNVVGSSSQLTSGYAATTAGQQSFFQAVVTNAKNAGAVAVFYWGGEWVAGSSTSDSNGSTWENQALFDFSWKAVPAMSVFSAN